MNLRVSLNAGKFLSGCATGGLSSSAQLLVVIDKGCYNEHKTYHTVQGRRRGQDNAVGIETGYGLDF
jgi:hypothetical protein